MFRGNATFSDTIYVICWFDVPVAHDPAFSEHVFGARLSHGQTGSGEIAVRRRPTQRKRAKTPKRTPLPSRNSLNFALDISFTSRKSVYLVSFLHIRWWKSGTRCQCCSRNVSESWCLSAMVVVTCKSVPLHRRQYSWNKELYGRESRCSGRSKGKQTWHAVPSVSKCVEIVN